MGSVMPYDDPTHWHSRADELRFLAENTKEGVSTHVMRWIAEDYKRLARMAEERAACRKVSVAVNEVRQYAGRKTHKSQVDDPPTLEIPEFLKQDSATGERERRS